MVLSAPMIAIAESRLGASYAASRAYAEILGGLGFGSTYARKGNDRPMEMEPFEDNPLTTDRDRYNRNRLVLEAAPSLGLGSPTIAWLQGRAALGRQAHRAGLPAARGGAAAAVRRRHGHDRFDARRSRSSRCG